MPELTDAQKVLRNDTGKRIADALEALASTGGRGLPAGGTDGDVLVKNGAGDYDARWEKPQYYPPNLLDNWYFVGGGSQLGNGVFPINSKGQASYTGAGYSIDRWTSGSNITVNVKPSCIGFVGNGLNMEQAIESGTLKSIIGKQITGTVLYADNTIETGTGLWPVAPESSGWNYAVLFSGNKLAFIAGTSIDANSNISGRVFLQGKQATEIEIVAVKLELGSYQTLAHQENGVWVLNEIPDWNVERYKCDPTIGSNLATVEFSSTASKLYNPGEYLVYNGQLYKVGGTAIGQGETLNPGQGGNIEATTVISAIDKKTEIESVFITPTANITTPSYAAKRFGSIVSIAFTFAINDAVGTWKNVDAFTMDVTIASRCYAVCMTNEGIVCCMEFLENTNKAVFRSLNQSFPAGTALRGTATFIIND